MGCSNEKHSITFRDLKKKNKETVYTFPNIVATDDFDNKKMYEVTMAPKIPLILDGFSMV